MTGKYNCVNWKFNGHSYNGKYKSWSIIGRLHFNYANYMYVSKTEDYLWIRKTKGSDTTQILSMVCVDFKIIMKAFTNSVNYCKFLATRSHQCQLHNRFTLSKFISKYNVNTLKYNISTNSNHQNQGLISNLVDEFCLCWTPRGKLVHNLLFMYQCIAF